MQGSKIPDAVLKVILGSRVTLPAFDPVSQGVGNMVPVTGYKGTFLIFQITSYAKATPDQLL
jgi:hypothetical protein